MIDSVIICTIVTSAKSGRVISHRIDYADMIIGELNINNNINFNNVNKNNVNLNYYKPNDKTNTVNEKVDKVNELTIIKNEKTDKNEAPKETPKLETSIETPKVETSKETPKVEETSKETSKVEKTDKNTTYLNKVHYVKDGKYVYIDICDNTSNENSCINKSYDDIYYRCNKAHGNEYGSVCTKGIFCKYKDCDDINCEYNHPCDPRFYTKYNKNQY